MNSTIHNRSTNWLAIWVLYLSGCTLALHIGKILVALPLLVDEFNMSLAQAGNIVSIYSALIALGGLLCGMFVGRLGYVMVAIVGVSLCVFGSIAGAFSTSVFMLMLSRVVEGLGWIMGVVAIPVIMSTLCTAKDRPIVMGLWGAFMSVGAGAMLLLAPQLHMVGGWRLSWEVAAGLSGAGVIAVITICYKHRSALQQLKSDSARHLQESTTQPAVAQLSIVPALVARIAASTVDLRTRGGVAVFGCFLCYSFQYTSVTSFLPSLMVEDSGLVLANASYWTALILIPNAIGNISAGWFINRGYKRSLILACAAILVGLFSLLTLSITETTLRLVAAFLMTGIGGIIPGTLFSTAPLLASTAAGSGVIIGFMLSGAGLGQLFGPVLVTRVVEWSGHWYTGGLLCLFAGLIGALLARWLSDIPVVGR